MPVPLHSMPKTRRVGWTSAALVLLGLGLGGCSSTLTLPHEGPDIKDVYDRHLGGQPGEPVWPKSPAPDANASPALSPHPLTRSGAELEGYSRSGATEIEQLFPQLPNPQVVMYVFPHRGGSGLPVPGYTTAFRLYDKTEYALPGEWISDAPTSDPASYTGLPPVAPIAPEPPPSTGSTDQFADPSNKPAR